MTKKLEDLIKSVIYHGRHFSPSRDAVVIKKSVDYILKLIKEKNDEQQR